MPPLALNQLKLVGGEFNEGTLCLAPGQGNGDLDPREGGSLGSRKTRVPTPVLPGERMEDTNLFCFAAVL